MTKKRKKTRGSLDNQRPAKKRALTLFWGLKGLCIIALVSASILAGFELWQRLQPWFEETRKVDRYPTNWHIELAGSLQEMSAKSRSKIEALAKDAFSQNAENAFLTLAESIQQELELASVTVLRSGYQSLVIVGTKRIPILLVEGHTSRHYVAKSGVVFGKADETTHLPILVGALEKQKHQRHMTGDLKLSDKEQAVIDKSLRLYDDAVRLGFSLKQISYEEFHGFTIMLANHEGLVSLGTDGFSQKFKRLETVLEDLRKKQRLAERIELEYTDKAFVKSKPM